MAQASVHPPGSVPADVQIVAVSVDVELRALLGLDRNRSPEVGSSAYGCSAPTGPYAVRNGEGSHRSNSVPTRPTLELHVEVPDEPNARMTGRFESGSDGTRARDLRRDIKASRFV